jgi:phosphoenolpyruvate carboxylase
MRTKKPTVLEEIITGLDYFRFSLFEAVCTTYRYAENSLNVSYSYTQGENITVSFWL